MTTYSGQFPDSGPVIQTCSQIPKWTCTLLKTCSSYYSQDKIFHKIPTLQEKNKWSSYMDIFFIYFLPQLATLNLESRAVQEESRRPTQGHAAQEIFFKIVAKKFKLYKNLMKRKVKYIDVTKKKMQIHKILQCHFINKKYRN